MTIITTLPNSTVSSTMTAIEARTAKEADKAINAILNQPALLQSMVDSSHRLVPVSSGRVMAMLWAVMNETGGGFIYKGGIDRAVTSQGGSTTQMDALWKMMSPDGQMIDPGDFAVNTYLRTVITLNMTEIQDAVEVKRREAFALESSASIMEFLHGGATSILSAFGGNTGTALDLFS